MPNGGTQRLFFALWPDDTVRQTLLQSQKLMLNHAHGRTIPVQNLHVTLCFLGCVPDSLCDDITAAAKDITLESFEFVLDEFVFRRRQRMIWLSAAHAPAVLITYVEQLKIAMRALNIDQENKAFHAHVTMMRNVRACSPNLMEQAVSLNWPVKEVALVRSQTLSSGAVYEVIAQIPLVS